MFIFTLFKVENIHKNKKCSYLLLLAKHRNLAFTHSSIDLLLLLAKAMSIFDRETTVHYQSITLQHLPSARF